LSPSEVIFVEHYDSFSANLADWLVCHGPKSARLVTIPYDEYELIAKLAKAPRPIVLSPGPGSPRDYPSTIELAVTALGRVPILGVCLGHQVLGIVAGGAISQLANPIHGQPVAIENFSSAPYLRQCAAQTTKVMSYNSLSIGEPLANQTWRVIARRLTGEIEAIENRNSQWFTVGVQFHPESFASEGTNQVARAFWRDVGLWYQANPIPPLSIPS
jgi:anthranilate synthase/aminodeoxychorismate synthase-like glutamine amidotransferase